MTTAQKSTQVQAEPEVNKELPDKEALLKELFPDGYPKSRREIRQAEKKLLKEQKEKEKAKKKAERALHPNIFRRNEGMIVAGVIGGISSLAAAALSATLAKGTQPTINVLPAKDVEVKDIPDTVPTVPTTTVPATE